MSKRIPSRGLFRHAKPAISTNINHMVFTNRYHKSKFSTAANDVNILTNDQIKHFQTYGYVAVPSFWDDNEILSIQTALYHLKNEGRLANVSTENDGVTHCEIPRNLQLCPLSPELALFKVLPFHSKVSNAISSLLCTLYPDELPIGNDESKPTLSDSAHCYLSQTFWKPPLCGLGTGWHQDNIYFKINGYRHGTAMWIPVHEARIDNGTLQVGHSLRYNNNNNSDGNINGDDDWVGGVLEHERDLTSDHHITCNKVMEKEEKLGNIRHIELDLGGVCFFNFNIPHRTGSNETNKERAAVAYHFVNETHYRERQFPLPEGCEYITPIITGSKNTYGKQEYGQEIGRMEIIENEMKNMLNMRQDVMRMNEIMQESNESPHTRLVEQDKSAILQNSILQSVMAFHDTRSESLSQSALSITETYDPEYIQNLPTNRHRKNGLYLNKYQSVTIHRFNHARPIPGTKYFSELSEISDKDGITVIIPFFNESAFCIEATLTSLYHCYKYMCEQSPNEWKKKPFNVCLIQDGWFKADSTCQKYLKRLFPCKVKPENVTENIRNNNETKVVCPPLLDFISAKRNSHNSLSGLAFLPTSHNISSNISSHSGGGGGGHDRDRYGSRSSASFGLTRVMTNVNGIDNNGNHVNQLSPAPNGNGIGNGIGSRQGSGVGNVKVYEKLGWDLHSLQSLHMQFASNYSSDVGSQQGGDNRSAISAIDASYVNDEIKVNIDKQQHKQKNDTNSNNNNNNNNNNKNIGPAQNDNENGNYLESAWRGSIDDTENGNGNGNANQGDKQHKQKHNNNNNDSVKHIRPGQSDNFTQDNKTSTANLNLNPNQGNDDEDSKSHSPEIARDKTPPDARYIDDDENEGKVDRLSANTTPTPGIGSHLMDVPERAGDGDIDPTLSEASVNSRGEGDRYREHGDRNYRRSEKLKRRLSARQSKLKQNSNNNGDNHDRDRELESKEFTITISKEISSPNTNNHENDEKNENHENVTPIAIAKQLQVSEQVSSMTNSTGNNNINKKNVQDKGKYWWHYFKEFKKSSYDYVKDGPVTFIFEKTIDVTTGHQPETFFNLRKESVVKHKYTNDKKKSINSNKNKPHASNSSQKPKKTKVVDKKKDQSIENSVNNSTQSDDHEVDNKHQEQLQDPASRSSRNNSNGDHDRDESESNYNSNMNYSNGNGYGYGNGNEPCMNITLIVKIDNRKKHNSHEWFFGESGFCDHYQNRYCFATDAFTQFDNKCLFKLVEFMDKREDVAAVTGRIKAMTRRTQLSKEIESRWSFEYFLRMVQTNEFLIQSLIYYPIFNLCGFLPVIPGPCGLFRASDVLQSAARDFYFDIVNIAPQDTGMIIGNFKIAEDRVLAYASVLKIKDDKKQMYVHDAIFYFECETEMNAYLFQRRRWINGTMAAFIYLLFSNPMLFWNSNISKLRKIIIMPLLIFNFLQMIFVVVVPAISFIVLKDSLGYVISNAEFITNSLNANVRGYVFYTIMLFSWGLFMVHMMVHNNVKWNGLIIKMLFWLSCFMTFSAAFCAIFVIFVTHDSFYQFYSETGVTFSELFINAIYWCAIAGLILPSVAIFLNEPRSVGEYFKSIVPLALAFHLVCGWFASYSFVRCWDLSWGNRPAQSELNQKSVSNIQAKIDQFKGINNMMNNNNNNTGINMMNNIHNNNPLHPRIITAGSSSWSASGAQSPAQLAEFQSHAASSVVGASSNSNEISIDQANPHTSMQIRYGGDNIDYNCNYNHVQGSNINHFDTPQLRQNSLSTASMSVEQQYGDTLDETDENIDPIVDLSEIKSERLRKKFKDYSKYIAIGLVIINLIVFFGPRNLQFLVLGTSMSAGSIFVYFAIFVWIGQCIQRLGRCIWSVL